MSDSRKVARKVVTEGKDVAVSHEIATGMMEQLRHVPGLIDLRVQQPLDYPTFDIAINRTKFGRGIRAVAQDSTTATLMGVSRERIIMTTFLIGGLLAGAAALLYTLKVPQGIIYSGGFLLGIKAFSAAVLGGIGNLRGALLGGLLLGIMENYGQAVFGTQWRDVVAFVLLVLVLLFRPTGILGESLGKARA